MMEKAITATIELASLSPYSQSRQHKIPKEESESWEQYEERTWRDHLHVNDQGHIVIPGMALKKAIATMAKLSGKKRKGKSTWTNALQGGCSPVNDLDTGLAVDDAKPEWVDCEVPGGGRVFRCYPVISGWQGKIDLVIFNPEIRREILQEFLEDAGLLIGMGRFRPEKGGTKGRFYVIDMIWKSQKLVEIQQRFRVA